MLLVNAIKHICLVTRHRWHVFVLCCKIGLPVRGLLHDLSKFSPTEFWESIKYYNGKRSPIVVCKEKNGYSKAWLHHKGRNKHHSDYWVDVSLLPYVPVMPYKYTAEMICDRLSAGMTYKGKEFCKEYPLEYWNKERNKLIINENVANMLTEVFTQISEKGINPVMTRKNIKALYKKHCIDK